MEVLNNIITNLTEEKENNAIKISNLLHENEKLKQSIKNNSSNTGTDVNNYSQSTEESNNKKYEEIIAKLKKNMSNLKNENKTLEELILRQESEVNQLSSKVDEVENVLVRKNKELQDSIEYTAKLTSSINFHKNEIMKIKQKQNQSDNNKNDKNSETIMNLQKELQNMKKNLEAKENKLSALSSNNKALQDKLNKLNQTIKNELSNNNRNNSKYNNNSKSKNNIYSSHNNYHTNKINISKPQSQLKNKTSRIPGAINPISSHILPKNNINNNIENYKDNYKNLEKSPLHNMQNIDDKKLFIVSKPKIKSKTPGKIINTKNQFPEAKPDIGNKHNIEIVNKKK
jgi:chromosome segregation ATPase